jgi:hypothetical protein
MKIARLYGWLSWSEYDSGRSASLRRARGSFQAMHAKAVASCAVLFARSGRVAKTRIRLGPLQSEPPPS